MLSQLFINFDSLIYKKIDKNILFEYNGASCHTSKSNKQLLNYLFDAKGWIQNSPSSPVPDERVGGGPTIGMVGVTYWGAWGPTPHLPTDSENSI